MSDSDTESLSDVGIDDEPIDVSDIEDTIEKPKKTTKKKPTIVQEDKLKFKNGNLKLVKKLAKPRQPMTPEQKNALVERLKAGKEKKKKERLGQLEEPNIEPELVEDIKITKEKKKKQREKTKKRIKKEAMKILKDEKIKAMLSDSDVSDSESDSDPDYKEVVKYVTKKKEKKIAKTKAKAKVNKKPVVKSESNTNDVIYQQYQEPQYTFL